MNYLPYLPSNLTFQELISINQNCIYITVQQVIRMSVTCTMNNELSPLSAFKVSGTSSR